MTTTLDRVRTVVTAHLEATTGLPVVAPLSPEARLLEDLAFDSLDRIEVAIFLEEEFDVEIPDAQIESTRTIADAVALIDRLCGAKRAAHA